MIAAGKVCLATFPRLLLVAFACLAFTLAGCESLAKMAKSSMKLLKTPTSKPQGLLAGAMVFWKNIEFALCLQNDVIALTCLIS